MEERFKGGRFTVREEREWQCLTKTGAGKGDNEMGKRISCSSFVRVNASLILVPMMHIILCTFGVMLPY